MNHRNLAVALTVFLAASAAASGPHTAAHDHNHAGEAGKASDIRRTVLIEMRDTMRFFPSSLSVQQGQTVRFVVKNVGRLKHEFVLGTKQDLEAHHALMKKSPEMEHDEDNMLRLAPGQSGELLWKFTQSGVVHLACLIPGHYEAGMRGKIAVAPVSGAIPSTKGVAEGHQGHH